MVIICICHKNDKIGRYVYGSLSIQIAVFLLSLLASRVTPATTSSGILIFQFR